jgi:hypothetical protein
MEVVMLFSNYHPISVTKNNKETKRTSTYIHIHIRNRNLKQNNFSNNSEEHLINV